MKKKTIIVILSYIVAFAMGWFVVGHFMKKIIRDEIKKQVESAK